MSVFVKINHRENYCEVILSIDLHKAYEYIKELQGQLMTACEKNKKILLCVPENLRSLCIMIGESVSKSNRALYSTYH